VTFGRVIHRDLPLTDGTIVPAGTIIGIPSHAISHDPKFYPSPSTFDGYRFVPDENSTAAQPPSFVTTNASNLSWGYGKHACSGRFFASNEIKIIIAQFLLNYDFKFARDQGRPKNWAYELQNMADPTVEVMVRRRSN
jgi:cytochrome P450